jgi:Tfp pilus assembly protein PilX
MCRLRNEKGIALVTTLMLMVLGFALVATLMVLVTQGTKLSGIEQRYTAALEASKGGTEMIIDMIRNSTFAPPAAVGNATSPSGCLQQKMTLATSGWTGSCPASSYPDVQFTLGSYVVSVKIIDTKDAGADGFLYTINSRAVLPSSAEKAEIFFVYQQK